jgi:molybdenum ABC transporter molybdate-binding protein
VLILLVATLALLGGSLWAPAVAQDAVVVYAAGSLRAALTEIAERFTAQSSIAVRLEFGASGTLRQRLEQGEAADVFASANMEHPRVLASQGKAAAVRLFARNELCALVRGGLPVTTATLLDVMLDPGVKLATSTPKADPSGDYAWEVFRKAEGERAGSRARLEQKALTLVGGPSSLQPPAGTTAYSYALQQGLADVFLTYCTNAREAVSTTRGATVVSLPPLLRVGADYGLTTLSGGRTDRASKLVAFILGPEGQQVLVRHGFSPATAPSGARP